MCMHANHHQLLTESPCPHQSLPSATCIDSQVFEVPPAKVFKHSASTPGGMAEKAKGMWSRGDGNVQNGTGRALQR